jgi:hypothetical protein
MVKEMEEGIAQKKGGDPQPRPIVTRSKRQALNQSLPATMTRKTANILFKYSCGI